MSDSCHTEDEMRTAIILTGAAGSGKDTVANAIYDRYPGQCFEGKFSAAIKDVACGLFEWDRDEIDFNLEYKEGVATWPDGTPQTRHSHTRRQILQILGTEMFRDTFDEDFWVRKLVNEIKESYPEDPWVISDCRFLNEFEALKEVFDQTLVIQLRRKGGPARRHNHSSELEWMQIPADVTIEADSGDTELLEDVAIRYVEEFLG